MTDFFVHRARMLFVHTGRRRGRIEGKKGGKVIRSVKGKKKISHNTRVLKIDTGP